MIKKIWYALAILGASLWEKHGFWIDKERGIAQMNYGQLPLLGKVGFKLMTFSLEMAGVDFNQFYN